MRIGLPNAPNKTRIPLTWGAKRRKQIVRESSVTGGAETFLELLDTPDTYYHANPNKPNSFVRVKTDETGLEFV